MTLPVASCWECVWNTGLLGFISSSLEKTAYLSLPGEQISKFVIYFTLKYEWDWINLKVKLAHDNVYWKTAQSTAALVLWFSAQMMLDAQGSVADLSFSQMLEKCERAASELIW